MGVQSLLADPEFQKLPPQQQKQALAGIDPEFANLSDDQFAQVKSGLAETTPQPRYTPTRFDRFVSGATGDLGAPSNPQDPIEQMVQGVGSSLNRTTQAWHDLFTGNPNASTIPEMVPLVGPWAVDTSRMLATPGQRTEGAGSLTMGLLPFAHEIPGPPPEIGAFAKGAAKGAYRGATDRVPINLKKFGVGAEFSVPAPIAGATGGAAAGETIGFPLGIPQAGAVTGGIVGGAAPIVRGAIQGGRQALRDLNTPPAVRWQPPLEFQDISPAELTPPPAVEPIPSALPSGRRVGGIQNQHTVPPPTAEMGGGTVPGSPAAVSTGVQQSFGKPVAVPKPRAVRNPNPKGTATATQPAPAPVPLPSSAPPTTTDISAPPVGDEFTERLRQAKITEEHHEPAKQAGVQQARNDQAKYDALSRFANEIDPATGQPNHSAVPATEDSYNALIKKFNATGQINPATGNKFKLEPAGSNYRPGGLGRSVQDTLRFFDQKRGISNPADIENQIQEKLNAPPASGTKAQ